MVANPNFYGQSTTGTPNQIEDGVDFPHTGIIKALSTGLGQNYAISGFDITIDSASQIDVGAGVIIRDGQRVAVSAVTNLTLTFTTANGYHLVVVNSSDAIVIRPPTAVNKVADYTDGDTLVAVVSYTGSNPMPIQYLTVSKKENSLSIGRDSSGYTESLTIQSNAGDVEIKATEQDKDIIFNVNDGGTDTEIMRIDGANGRVGIGTDSPAVPLHVKKNHASIFRLQDASGDGTAANVYQEFYDENSRMGYLGYASGTNADFSIVNSENARLRLYTNGTEYVRIESGGDFRLLNDSTLIAPLLDTVSSSASSYTLSKTTNAGRYLIYSGTGTVNLPTTSTAGEQYTILNTSSGDITVGRNTNDINGASNDVTVGTFNGVTCIAIGSNDWIALGV